MDCGPQSDEVAQTVYLQMIRCCKIMQSHFVDLRLFWPIFSNDFAFFFAQHNPIYAKLCINGVYRRTIQ